MAEYVLSLSYGKDSLACLGAIRHLGWPLHRIVTADVWATDTIPAEYPPVVEFKAYVDEWILREFGITVEHYCATKIYDIEKEKVSYEDGLYYTTKTGKFPGTLKGFPMQQGPWCNNLKMNALKQAEKMTYEKLFYHVRQSGNRKGEIVGFHFVGAPECQKALKVAALRRAERERERAGRRRAIHWYCGRRAEAHSLTHQQARHHAPAGGAGLGRRFVRTVVQVQRPDISHLHNLYQGRLLVLP